MAERAKHTDAEQSEEKKTSTTFVLEACLDLHNQEQSITRLTLQAALPHLTLGKIDDRLSYLVDNNYLMRVERGVYVPIYKHPPARLINKMVLSDGTVKIEIGDEIVLTLTPKEARDLGCLMVADAMQYGNIELGRTMNYVTQNIGSQLNKLTRSIESMCEAQFNRKGA
ncbi:hypothetical protein ABEF82_14815 [Acinetobacter thermotolerans]|uniref:hypothetical protein n=1 Tax=Acinetobacter thermotolerans TaxID=3151487 RepID=UPI00325B24B9